MTDTKNLRVEIELLSPKLQEIHQYWNDHIHDLAIAKHPPGTLGFFNDLDEYRFDKLNYLPRVVDFSAYAGKKLLEVGCGVGIDLVHFAEKGAVVTGVDLADTSIELARKNFELRNLKGEFYRLDGENLPFEEASFDVVYAHGVLQYTENAQKMTDEIYRVLKPGGEAILMVYNKISWLNALSKIMKVDLEHEDAPVLNKYSIREFKKLLTKFEKVKIVPERFPVKSRLHKGVKGMLYNGIFVPSFKIVPKFLVRPLGWHIMAFAYK